MNEFYGKITPEYLNRQLEVLQDNIDNHFEMTVKNGWYMLYINNTLAYEYSIEDMISVLNRMILEAGLINYI